MNTDPIDRARQALHAIDPGCDRDAWVRAAMAAKAAGLDEGDFRDWSASGANYAGDRDVRSVWRSIKPNGGIGPGTLFSMAHEAGWREPLNGHHKPQERPQAARKVNGKAAPSFDADAVWRTSEPATADHEYIRRKLGLPDGLRVVPADSTLRIAGQAIAGWLAVPLFDGEAEVPATLQFIGPDAGKLTAPGPMAGWFTVGGRPTPGATVYVCEGIGQAWSAHQASRSPAVVAFGAGRMESVARALLAQVPGVRVVLVADVGQEAKVEASARALRCAWVAPPADLGRNGDINDLHQRAGLAAVAELLSRAKAPPAEDVDDDRPREIDLAALAATEPEPPEFIVPGWLPAGEITLLAANGGTGKSLSGLHLAVCLVLGRDWHGVPVQQRRVDFVSFEDSKAVMHWRLHRVCRAIGVDVADVVGKLRILDGTTSASAWYSRGQFGETGPTAAFHDMAERIGGPACVVIVDGSSDTFAGNENDRAQVKAFVRMLRRLIAPDGALLLLAHVDKLSAKAGADSLGFSGSTGWNNGVRCRWFMFHEADENGSESGNVCVEVRKSNLGKTGARMVLKFDEAAGVFLRVDVPADGGRLFQRVDEAEAIVCAIREAWAAGDPIPAAQGGQRTAHAVCEARESFPAALKGQRNRSASTRTLEQLRAAGKVEVQPFRKPNRHVVEVLNVRD